MSPENPAPVPAPPVGYRIFTPPSNPSLGPLARLLVTGWVLTVLVLGGALWRYHGPYLPIFAAALVVVVVHELIHAAAGWAIGMRITAGVDFDGLETGPYILPYGDFQTRRESVLLAAAPSLVLTPVLLLIAVVGGTATMFAALAALFANMLGAVSDFQTVVTTLQTPTGTLTYPARDGEVWYFVRS